MDSLGSGTTLDFAPNLLNSVANDETITIASVPFTVAFTQDISQFNTDTTALFGFTMSLIEVFNEMDRGSTSAFQTEIVKSANKPFHLLVLSFDDVVYYLSDAYIPVTYNGNEYTPTGDFKFSDIVETNETNIGSINIALSGIPTTYVNLFLTDEYLDDKYKFTKHF